MAGWSAMPCWMEKNTRSISSGLLRRLIDSVRLPSYVDNVLWLVGDGVLSYGGSTVGRILSGLPGSPDSTGPGVRGRVGDGGRILRRHRGLHRGTPFFYYGSRGFLKAGRVTFFGGPLPKRWDRGPVSRMKVEKWGSVG